MNAINHSFREVKLFCAMLRRYLENRMHGHDSIIGTCYIEYFSSNKLNFFFIITVIYLK